MTRNVDNEWSVEKINTLLPEGYSWDTQNSVLIYCNNTQEIPLCNFVPVPLGQIIKNSTSLEKVAEPSIRIGFYLGATYIKQHLDISSNDIDTTFYKCYLNLYAYPNIKQISSHISFIVRFLSDKIPQKMYICLDKLGYQKMQNQSVYIAGTTILTQEGKVEKENIIFSESIKKYSLHTKLSASDQAIGNYMVKLAQLCPNVSVPLLSMLTLSLTQELFAAADYKLDFWMFLVGDSETMKTTIAQLITTIYNRSGDLQTSTEGLTSTSSACEYALYTFNDSIVVFDDLCITDSSAMTREQTNKLIALHRAHTNRTPKKRKSGDIIIGTPSRAMVVVTAERKFSMYSVASRSIHISASRKPPYQLLTELQKEQVLLSDWVTVFIPYVLKNKSELTSNLKKQRIKLYTSLTDNNDYIRTKNYIFALEQAFFVFWDHICQLANIPEAEKSNQTINVTKIFEKLSRENISFLESSRTKTHKYSEIFAKSFEAFKFGTSPDSLDFNDGYWDRGKCYIKPQSLLNFIREYYDNPNITLPCITRNFKEHGLLFSDQTGASTKKRGRSGIRVLDINFEELNALYGTYISVPLY